MGCARTSAAIGVDPARLHHVVNAEDLVLCGDHISDRDRPRGMDEPAVVAFEVMEPDRYAQHS